MDRNIQQSGLHYSDLSVALRKESVDRNVFLTLTVRNVLMSLSARRAWIEITQRRDFKRLGLVALRKESVDRNIRVDKTQIAPSVALRKESVDRNQKLQAAISGELGRSPQGERG